MHPLALRRLARHRVVTGESTASVAADLGLPRSVVWRWVNREFVSDGPIGCPVENSAHELAGTSYAYLLGQYLGDGHLVTSSRTPVLRIYTCTDYPAIVDEVSEAISDVRGSAPAVMRAAGTHRMAKVQSYWMHWPCLFPQHGPGRKHERPIVLADWQQAIVDEHPWALIRGLIHSDGCRSINRVVVRGRTYRYPRYLFANESRDILAIMGRALDVVGVEWRFNRPNSISVARRASVAVLDEHVGPKT